MFGAAGIAFDQKKVDEVFIRLMFAARALAFQGTFAMGGTVQICPWCGWRQPEGEAPIPGRHERACCMGVLTGLLAELEGLMTVTQIAERIDSFSEGRAGRHEAERKSGAAAKNGVGAGIKGPGRKPPARALPGESGGAVAVLPLTADFGEPWRTAPADSTLVIDRAGIEIHVGMASELAAGDDLLYARRIAAAVNLCAGAPTEALESAFEEIASSTPRWALLAFNIQNLNTGQIAGIRDFIDDVVKYAAVPVPIDYGRPQ